MDVFQYNQQNYLNLASLVSLDLVAFSKICSKGQRNCLMIIRAVEINLLIILELTLFSTDTAH